MILTYVKRLWLWVRAFFGFRLPPPPAVRPQFKYDITYVPEMPPEEPTTPTRIVLKAGKFGFYHTENRNQL